MTAIIQNNATKEVTTIYNVTSIGVHPEFTAINYKDENGHRDSLFPKNTENYVCVLDEHI